MEAKNEVFLTDTHAHLASQKFANDLDHVIENAKTSNVRRLISIACDWEDSLRNVELSEQYEEVYATVGVHPLYVHEIDPEKDWIGDLRKLSSHTGVCGLGEMGLDYFHPPQDGYSEGAWKQSQREVFEKQLQLALSIEMPVVIHQRNSWEDVLAVMRQFPGVKAVWHCFGGTITEAEQVLELGHFLSFTGVLTFKNASEVREVAQNLPLDRIMVETDCPYLAPVPYRGKRCEPAMVSHTNVELARIFQKTPSEMAAITTQNALDFFKFSQKCDESGVENV